MDTMKISTKFMKGVVSRILKGVIKKKIGYDVDIQLDEFMITFDGTTAHVRLNAAADISKDELTKVIKEFGLE